MNQKGIHRGVRAVALFEAAKGLLMLLAGFGAFQLMHRDSRALAVEFVGWLNLHPTGRYSSVFIGAASHVTDQRLWMFAGFALLYAGFRLLEAYGLWRERAWAEWLAVVSGGIYLPVEIYEVVLKFTPIRVGVLAGNLLVVVFMAAVLWKSHKARLAAAGDVMARGVSDG